MTPERIEELARAAMPVGAAYEEDWEDIADAIRTAVREALENAIALCWDLRSVEAIRALRDELTAED